MRRCVCCSKDADAVVCDTRGSPGVDETGHFNWYVSRRLVIEVVVVVAVGGVAQW